jgi:hypothetical protein
MRAAAAGQPAAHAAALASTLKVQHDAAFKAARSAAQALASVDREAAVQLQVPRALSAAPSLKPRPAPSQLPHP